MDNVLEYSWEGEINYATLDSAVRVKGNLEKVGKETYKVSLEVEKSVPMQETSIEVKDEEFPVTIYGWVPETYVEELVDAGTVDEAFATLGELVSKAVEEIETGNN